MSEERLNFYGQIRSKLLTLNGNSMETNIHQGNILLPPILLSLSEVADTTRSEYNFEYKKWANEKLHFKYFY